MANVNAGRFAVLLALAAVIAVASSVYFYHQYQPWLAVHTGSANSVGVPPNYNYWSGFGGVFPWEVGFFVGFWTYVYQHTRKTNCHTHRCLRIGTYPVGDYRVCKKHHLEVHGTHPTVRHLKNHLEEVRNGGPGSNPGIDS